MTVSVTLLKLNSNIFVFFLFSLGVIISPYIHWSQDYAIENHKTQWLLSQFNPIISMFPLFESQTDHHCRPAICMYIVTIFHSLNLYVYRLYLGLLLLLIFSLHICEIQQRENRPKCCWITKHTNWNCTSSLIII